MSNETILSHEWRLLSQLRQRFLEGSAGEQNYWDNSRLLELYDQTFAERIAWKWQYVFSELRRFQWHPPALPLLDWGCGTGIASRAFLRAFALAQPKLILHDRSPLATKFAEEKIRKEFPAASFLPFDAAAFQGVAVLSHVITELSDSALSSLLSNLRAATAILWVESGEYRASRKLIEARERLRADFHVVAPCPHQGRCGLLAAENDAHWCHHFAKPPHEAFTQKRWAEFKARLGIDLSQLPLSYLVLDKRPAPPLPREASRLIGAARLYKGYALVLACSERGVAECRLSERKFPQPYRQMKKGEFDALFLMRSDNGDIVQLDALQERRASS